MKKVHYVGGCWRASVDTTTDWRKVTCDLCLRHKHINKVRDNIKPSPNSRYTDERDRFGFSDRRI